MSPPLDSIRVALVHDWLTGMRGGEKVLEVFAELFPAAPIYTLVKNAAALSPTLASRASRTSPLQGWPGGVKRYPYYLPVMPWLVRQLTIEPVDLVLSTSSCVAKAVVPPPGARHACYMHSPMRYLYDRYADYFSPGRASLVTRAAMTLCRRPLQWWDQRSNTRIDALATNSHFVADRIDRLYNRRATVIAPPVDTERFRVAGRNQPTMPDRDAPYLMVAALVPYKNVDIAIEAFRSLPSRRLVIVGSGPMEAKLRACLPANVRLLGWLPDAEVVEQVAGCRAFLMPNVEDFGIAPVEAMAAGRPVIALGAGGVLDSIRDLDRWRQDRLPGPLGPTGLFFDDPTPAGLIAAIHRFERYKSLFHAADAVAWAKTFDRPRFERAIVEWLSQVVDGRTAQPYRHAA